MCILTAYFTCFYGQSVGFLIGLVACYFVGFTALFIGEQESKDAARAHLASVLVDLRLLCSSWWNSSTGVYVLSKTKTSADDDPASESEPKSAKATNSECSTYASATATLGTANSEI